MAELHLNLNAIQENKDDWEKQGFELPSYAIEKVRQHTISHPHWLHFGAGNIFRAFPARVQDELLDRGEDDTGILVAETFRAGKLDAIFTPYDNLSTAVTLKSDGTLDIRVIGAIAETIKADGTSAEDWARLEEVFKSQSLAVVSFTITEKGYNIKDGLGAYPERVLAEFQDSNMQSTNTMGIVAKLLYARYQAGGFPLTLVSMDNVSHNGDLLRAAVLAYAEAWTKNEFADEGFYAYVSNPEVVSFPWSMIDKITPVADPSIGALLREKGYMDIEGQEWEGVPQAPSYANAEETEYLVIEDAFRNGRPKWDHGGVIFTDRDTVDRVETMKVTTCLNPLHTALAVYGCLLDYNYIHEQMKDDDLVNLIKGVGYVEGLPVVVNPGILDPKAFIDTVIEERFPNPFLPDTPQRIATDTSQKIAIRYGKTLTNYLAEDANKLQDLVFIPSVLAGWLRYLLGVNDKGETMTLSSDPMLADMQVALAEVGFGNNTHVDGVLRAILANESLFGVDLEEAGLVEKIITIFKKLNEGPGAVREYLASLPRV